MSRRDAAGLLCVTAALVAMAAYRAWYIEPREWGGICAAAVPPLACYPRAALLWMQHYYLWGLGALALGLWAFVGASFGAAVGAVALGGAAVANYNATWGMLGLALGASAWLRRRGAAAAPDGG
jgi:hypothetical protein